MAKRSKRKNRTLDLADAATAYAKNLVALTLALRDEAAVLSKEAKALRQEIQNDRSKRGSKSPRKRA